MLLCPRVRLAGSPLAEEVLKSQRLKSQTPQWWQAPSPTGGVPTWLERPGGESSPATEHLATSSCA